MIFKIFSDTKEKFQLPIFIGLGILFIFLNAGFNYVNWDPTLSGNILKVCFFIFIFYFFYLPKKKQNTNFKSIVLLLAFLPYLSSINTYRVYNQDFFDSFKELICNSLWLFYFFLHKWKVKEETLLKIFFSLSVIVFGIQVVQNLFPDSASFGIINDDLMEGDTIAEVRNGILRFRLGNTNYITMPILLAFWCYLKNNSYNRLMAILVCVFMISIYLTLTRQVIAACLLAILMSFFLGRKFSFKNAFLLIFIIIGLYFAYDVLFSELSQNAVDDMNEDYIRVLSFNYYLSKDTQNVFSWIFGYGVPASRSVFSREIYNLQQFYHFYASDVGVVGKWFHYGLPNVLLCYYFLYLVFWRYKLHAPLYIRLFTIYGAVMSPMIFPMWGPSYYLVWAIVAYIVDLHVNKSSLALYTTSRKEKASNNKSPKKNYNEILNNYTSI